MNITGGSYMSDHFWELEGETRNKAVLSNTVENYFLHRSCWNRCLLTSNLAQHWKQKVSDSLKPIENSLFQFSASVFQLVWLSFIITHLAKTPTPKFLSFDLLSFYFHKSFICFPSLDSLPFDLLFSYYQSLTPLLVFTS